MDAVTRRLRLAVGAATVEVLAQVGLLVAWGALGGAAPRAAIAAGALVVMVLLGRAISAYPTVEWRPR